MRHLKLVCTLVALTAFSAVISSQTSSGHAVFEQALAKERVEGNLTEAIKLYERVVTEFAADRALAARALVQIGLSYEKLGRDEAVRAYERLVRDFADQQDAVVQARARLAILRPPAAAAVVQAPSVRALPTIRNSEMLALSPDGTKIAMITYDVGQNLAVYDLATQKTTSLTNFEWSGLAPWVYEAAWSPDSRRIAYMQCSNVPERLCELRVTTLSGESRLIAGKLTDTVRPGGWLSDGSAIVVTLQRRDRTATIGLMPTDGGPFVPLRSTGGWSGTYAQLASVSPDGQLIAFVEGSPGDVHVITPDGRTIHRITDHPAEDGLPIWSPDGRHLAFLSDRGGAAALWTVSIKDGQPASEPLRVKDGMEDVYPVLGWTVRGFVYSQRQQTDDIYTVSIDPASGELLGRPRMIPYRSTGHNIHPEWSPDGKYLAFVSSSTSRNDDPARRVVLLPSGGGQAREFSTPAHRLWSMRWFGDNRGLGITGHDAQGERHLFRLTLATGEWQAVPLPVTDRALQWNGMYFDWNADGSRYVYAWQDAFRPSELTILERNLQADRERIIYRGKPSFAVDRFRGLRASPDRRSLSFTSVAGVHLLDLESGQARVLRDSVAGDVPSAWRPSEVPTWSSNGRALLVNRTENPGTEKQAIDLRLFPAADGEVRRIPLGPELTRVLSVSAGRGAPRPNVEHIVWSPDGTQLAFEVRATRLDTFMIENPLALVDAAK
jgi:Tol biopolymer transport system component